MEINQLKEMVRKIIASDFINFKEAPDNTGVYMLYKKNKLVYIGVTLGLKRRLRGLFSNNPTRHVFNKRIPKGYYTNCSVKILQIENIWDAKALESFLIAKFRRPWGNRG